MSCIDVRKHTSRSTDDLESVLFEDNYNSQPAPDTYPGRPDFQTTCQGSVMENLAMEKIEMLV